MNSVDNYTDYMYDNIKIFSDTDNGMSTFEISLYHENKKVCDNMFQKGRKTLSVQEYMLKNKADVAFKLLEKNVKNLNTPKYIEDAIKWIRK